MPDDPPHSAHSALPHILVDLTPLAPGGANGGAKPLVLELLQAQIRLRPSTRFTLLTQYATHEELAPFDGPNAGRVCMVGPPAAGSGGVRGRIGAHVAVWENRVYRWVPRRARESILRPYHALRNAVARRPSVGGGASLLFCPFTAPTFHQPRVPAVCLIHDLQFLTNPQFFDPRDVGERLRHFRQACSAARTIICPSGYVRGRIEEAAEPPCPRVEVIPHAVHGRLPAVCAADRTAALARFGLSPGGYFLYPANFWQHKNHELLLTAYALYRRQCPEASLRLVLTGETGARAGRIAGVAQGLGIGADVLMTGFIPDADLASLMEECAAVVFPSLYEGFGMPVLEAMHLGRPVLCARGTALPEVAGEAALYFDPRSPFALAEALTVFSRDSGLARSLARRAREHAAASSTLDQMAARYLAVFEAAGMQGAAA